MQISWPFQPTKCAARQELVLFLVRPEVFEDDATVHGRR